jgi:HEAT repeat protein
MARLPWSLVNETSDRVRLASAIKLIQSPVAKFQTEGFNAMKDDSAWVRERFAAYLADHPTEAHRASLRIGVVDASVMVRLQAVRGLAALLEPLTVPEIQPAFTDKYPEVVVAVISAVKARNLVVPEAVRKEWRESKYAAVRDAEKTLN